MRQRKFAPSQENAAATAFKDASLGFDVGNTGLNIASLCGIAAVAILSIAIVVMLGFVLYNTAPETIVPAYPTCPDRYLCSTEADCPTVYAVDLRELDSWDVNTSTFSLVQGCTFGRCGLVHHMELTAPNWTEFGMGENWTTTVFGTLINLTNTSYEYPVSQLFGFVDPIYRDTRAPWGDLFSSMCMSFIHEDYRTDLVPHIEKFLVTNTSLITTCHFLYNCYAPFDFPGKLAFPAYKG
jgi:hypothetical protein